MLKPSKVEAKTRVFRVYFSWHDVRCIQLSMYQSNECAFIVEYLTPHFAFQDSASCVVLLFQSVLDLTCCVPTLTACCGGVSCALLGGAGQQNHSLQRRFAPGEVAYISISFGYYHTGLMELPQVIGLCIPMLWPTSIGYPSCIIYLDPAVCMYGGCINVFQLEKRFFKYCSMNKMHACIFLFLQQQLTAHIRWMFRLLHTAPGWDGDAWRETTTLQPERRSEHTSQSYICLPAPVMLCIYVDPGNIWANNLRILWEWIFWQPATHLVRNFVCVLMCFAWTDRHMLIACMMMAVDALEDLISGRHLQAAEI